MINKHSIISDPGALSIVHQADNALKEIKTELAEIDRSRERFREFEKKKHQRQLQATVAAMTSLRSPSRNKNPAGSHDRRHRRMKASSDFVATASRPAVIADILDDFERRSKLPLPSEFPFDKVDKDIQPRVEQRAVALQVSMTISDSMPVRRVIKITRRVASASEIAMKNSLRALVAEKLALHPGSCSMLELFEDSPALMPGLDVTIPDKGMSSTSCSSPTSPLAENRLFPSEMELTDRESCFSSQSDEDEDEDDSEIVKRYLHFPKLAT